VSTIALLDPVMDTLTHALSGALLARATAPPEARITVAARVAAGFCVAAFPDIDFLLAYVSPAAYLMGHRSITHSVFALPLWALVIAWVCAKIDRNHGVSWRDYFVVSALALSAHIVGDLITSFGTMIYAPFSDVRIAWSTTFVIDLCFTAIIVVGLIASWLWRQSSVPAVLATALLVGYVGMQAILREQALAFGVEHAKQEALDGEHISAIPRPVSPFNWMVVVSDGNRYHYTNVNLLRAEPVSVEPGANLLARLDAAYAPIAEATWTSVEKYGADPSMRELAERILADPKLDFFVWFADYPMLFQIERGNPSTCVWFEDLRFTIPGRDGNPFRYGLCGEGSNPDWRAFRLLGDGTREPAR
jgi:inner membrane protein